jgi:hypothetical protein
MVKVKASTKSVTKKRQPSSAAEDTSSVITSGLPTATLNRIARKKKNNDTTVTHTAVERRTDSRPAMGRKSDSNPLATARRRPRGTTSKPIEESDFTLYINGAERQFSSKFVVFDFLVGHGNIQLTTSQSSEMRSMDQGASTAANSVNCSGSRAIFVRRETPVSVSSVGGADAIRVANPARAKSAKNSDSG